MTKKIFRSFMVSAAAVLLAAVAIVMTCLYSYFASVQENQLQDQLHLAAAAVETQGRDYLNKLTADRYRLTWIAPDGAVLCDTKRDAESLENHGDRTEVREALRTGSGHSTRYSSTLLEKTSYYARRMPDGTVLRISISRATVGMLLLGMLPAILLTAAVALILSGLLAGRLSRRITAPLNALDLEHPLENDTYEELSPLLCRINVQRRQIDSQLTDLRRRSDEFQQITSHMQEGLVLLDDAGAVLSINPAACRIFEADETCLGQDFLTVDRSRDVSAALEEAMASGHSEVHVQRPGRIYQFDISRIRSGEDVLGAVLLAFDITQQETAEQSRREFTANVSHELRSPMTSMQGFLQGMLDGTIPAGEQKQYMQIVLDETRRLSKLVGNLLNLSRMENSNTELAYSDFDLHECIRRVIIANMSQLDDKRMDLQLSFEDEPMFVHADADQIEQVLVNLLSNAVKYTPEGGHIAIDTAQEGKLTRVVVRDDGPGVAPEDAPYIFDRFYKADKAHTVGKGTGLGLAICKRIMDKHGQSLCLLDTKEGAAFEFTLESGCAPEALPHAEEKDADPGKRQD